MAVTYEWAEEHRCAADAMKIGRAIEKIARQAGGICSPAAYVEAARDPQHVFHPTLEWDDQVAAEAHRRGQARAILRGLRVVGGNPEIPAFVHIRVEEAEGYVAQRELETNRDYHAFVVAEASARLSQVRRRYAALQELASVWAAIDSFEEERVAA